MSDKRTHVENTLAVNLEYLKLKIEKAIVQQKDNGHTHSVTADHLKEVKDFMLKVSSYGYYIDYD